MSGITEVIEDLYISGLESPTAIIHKGIRSVINVTSECPIQNLGPSVDYEKVNVADVPTAAIHVYFERLTDRIHRNLQQGIKTLVHCYVGRSRSATIILAYLMKYQNMCLRDAFYYLRARRPIIGPNFGFIKQLISYERSLFGTTSVFMVDTSLGEVPDIYVSMDSSYGSRRSATRSTPITRTSSSSYDRSPLTNRYLDTTGTSRRPMTSSMVNDDYGYRRSSFIEEPIDFFSTMNKPWLTPSESILRSRPSSQRYDYPSSASSYNRYFLP